MNHLYRTFLLYFCCWNPGLISSQNQNVHFSLFCICKIPTPSFSISTHNKFILYYFSPFDKPSFRIIYLLLITYFKIFNKKVLLSNSMFCFQMKLLDNHVDVNYTPSKILHWFLKHKYILFCVSFSVDENW